MVTSGHRSFGIASTRCRYTAWTGVSATLAVMSPISDQITNIKHRFIQVNGIKMHIAEQGEGPLVMLAHGWPE